MLRKVESDLIWEDDFGYRIPFWLFNPRDKDANPEWLRAFKNGELHLTPVNLVDES